MAFADLKKLFDDAARAHPDLMERYVTLLGDVDDAREVERIMRMGLAETFTRRYPLAGEAA